MKSDGTHSKPAHNDSATSMISSLQVHIGSHRLSAALMTRVLVTGILAAAGFLRMWKINTFGYNSDEAVYSGQAAALAGDPALREIFPIFRAHPLLHQFLMALLFFFGVDDLRGRLLVVAIGLGTIYVVYLLGKLLYGTGAGLLAALFMALMPYHVIVTRQVLLDGPLVFCSTLTLYLLAKYATTKEPIWLHASGVGLGLTFLAKETGIILLGAIYAFLALSGEIRVRLSDLALSLLLLIVMILPFPVSLWLAGGSSIGQSYLIWQLVRQPNHTWEFYATTVPQAIGYLVILAAVVGLWLARRERSWRETLLIWWIIVPVIFFQLWPTKGYQYLLPITPAFAILAGRTLSNRAKTNTGQAVRSEAGKTGLSTLFAGVIAVSLSAYSWQQIQPSISGSFLAGTGGVPGGREAGRWVLENTPAGATLLTIGPSMGNIIQFYGHRRAYGLSVSTNPLRRNPAYQPVINPDQQIRLGAIQYLVWDAYSASRSAFFSERVLRLARDFSGRVIHTESVTVTLDDGSLAQKPVIIIYEVRQ